MTTTAPTRDNAAYVKARFKELGLVTWPYRKQMRTLVTHLKHGDVIDCALTGRWDKHLGESAMNRSLNGARLQGTDSGFVVLTKASILFATKDHVNELPVNQVTMSRYISGSLTFKFKKRRPFSVNGINPSGSGVTFAKAVRDTVGVSDEVDRLEISNADYVETRLAELGIGTFLSKKEMRMLAERLGRREVIEHALRCSWGSRKTKHDQSHQLRRLSSGYVALTKGRVLFASKERVAVVPVGDIESVRYSRGDDLLISNFLDILCKAGPSFAVEGIKTHEAGEGFATAINDRIAVYEQSRPRHDATNRPRRKREIEDRSGDETPADYVARRFDEVGIRPTSVKGECHMLASRLDSGERILHAVKGAFAPDLQQFRSMFGQMMHNGVAVLTSKRILFLDKSWFGSEEVGEVPVARVESVSTSRGIALGGLHIHCIGASSYRIEMVDPASAAEEFAKAVRKEIERRTAEPIQAVVTATAQPAPVPTASVADELIKLKGLLDAGAIDHTEYDVLKASLIPNP